MFICPVSLPHQPSLWMKLQGVEQLSEWKIPGAIAHLPFPKDTEQVHLANSCTLPISLMSSCNLSVFLRQRALGVRMSVTHGWLIYDLINVYYILGPCIPLCPSSADIGLLYLYPTYLPSYFNYSFIHLFCFSYFVRKYWISLNHRKTSLYRLDIHCGRAELL